MSSVSLSRPWTGCIPRERACPPRPSGMTGCLTWCSALRHENSSSTDWRSDQVSGRLHREHLLLRKEEGKEDTAHSVLWPHLQIHSRSELRKRIIPTPISSKHQQLFKIKIKWQQLYKALVSRTPPPCYWNRKRLRLISKMTTAGATV